MAGKSAEGKGPVWAVSFGTATRIIARRIEVGTALFIQTPAVNVVLSIRRKIRLTLRLSLAISQKHVAFCPVLPRANSSRRPAKTAESFCPRRQRPHQRWRLHLLLPEEFSGFLLRWSPFPRYLPKRRKRRQATGSEIRECR